MTATAALLAAVEIGDPLTRGSLALFPLFHELDAAPQYLSGPRSGEHLHIGEVADLAVVPEMEVLNESPYPVLLLDGETLLGVCRTASSPLRCSWRRTSAPGCR